VCFSLKFSSANLVPYMDWPPNCNEEVRTFHNEQKRIDYDTCSIASSEVTSLAHKVRDDAMEFA